MSTLTVPQAATNGAVAGLPSAPVIHVHDLRKVCEVREREGGLKAATTSCSGG